MAYDTAPIALGASIGCSGVCLTVVAKEPGLLTFEASAETLACSTSADGARGRGSISSSDETRRRDGRPSALGHVDGVAEIVDRRPDGESVRFTIAAPDDLAPFIAPKGSVALDGVSLTVNEVDGTRFGVNIIPHTLSHTVFGNAGPGTKMNLEIDLIARYVGRLLEARGGR